MILLIVKFNLNYNNRLIDLYNLNEEEHRKEQAVQRQSL